MSGAPGRERPLTLMIDLRGKRVLVLGLGVHGGGLGVARFMVGQGAQVRVTDMKDAGGAAGQPGRSWTGCRSSMRWAGTARRTSPGPT